MIEQHRWIRAYNRLTDRVAKVVTYAETIANMVIIAARKSVHIGKKEYTLDEVNKFAEAISNRLGVPAPFIVLSDIIPSNYQMHNPYSLTYTGAENVYINQLQAWESGIPLEMVIAHEIRHYYQNVTGRLSCDYQGNIWDGELTAAGWYDSPWEADAVEYENIIAIELGLPISRIVVGGKVYDHGNRKVTRG
jgi:hypothetical protein